MRIAIIGTGNVAYHLARRLKETGHPPVYIGSRTAEKGHKFVQALGLNARVGTDTSLRKTQSDFVLIAVPDKQIKHVLASYSFDETSVLLHTSGAQAMDLLKGQTSNYGVLYPFQTFSKEKPVDFDAIPLLIEGNSPETTRKIMELAGLLGPRVRSLSSEQRLQVHLAAVFACNFSNHLFSIADNLMNHVDLELSDLEHLIRETVDKALQISPQKAQTGPAIRNDTEILEKHSQLLQNKDLRQLYELHSRLIRQKGQ